ncbi:hypothetical protein HPP92_001839 [Vanilla planifolia]|uniref:AB hydrolase-1 domain-containing protein n=1 Tax=Vanilla planifolia TaxID=51239 RepID=A0A835SDL5_VANPL|nr:hypothetical protein HPP92_002037 [Vanilla planifolia]KAG0501767.1 hypothetical protein HPP92_001839 [Vanilla planifolia]
MGNALGCIPRKEFRGGTGSRSKMSSRPRRKMSTEEDLLHRQALAMAIQQHHLSQRFDGSMSRRIGSISSRKQTPSSSFRKQVPIVLDKLETKRIVLVHGEGFGAWCWYKIIPLLEDAGLHPVALDMASSGMDHTDIHGILSLADYSKPLIDYLQNLPEDEKVILVGHSCGGASISYALECCPKKISKAIYVSATMVLGEQTPFDVFAKELASAEGFMQDSPLLMYDNGKKNLQQGSCLIKNYSRDFISIRVHPRTLLWLQSP